MDKFCLPARCAEVLAQLPEIATLFDIGRHAEEVLSYFKTTVTLEPTPTVLCVQQVLFFLLRSPCARGGYTYATVFNLPARRQPHSVFGAFVHAGTICLFPDP